MVKEGRPRKAPTSWLMFVFEKSEKWMNESDGCVNTGGEVRRRWVMGGGGKADTCFYMGISTFILFDGRWQSDAQAEGM